MPLEKEYPIAGPVTAAGASQITANALAASAGVPGAINAISPNAKTYFVAFDGTGNNKYDLNKPPTNVTALFNAADAGLTVTDSGIAKYYQGAGTQSNSVSASVDGLLGTSVLATASQAYKEFVSWAQDQYSSNPNVEITLAGASFSRGGGTHTAFLNEVWNKGVPNPDYPNDPREFLISPKTANLGVNVFFDRVLQGIRSDATELLPDAPLSKFRALEFIAQDEHRREFIGDPLNSQNNSDQRVLSLYSPGDHSDIGKGHFQTGIGLYTLDGAYKYLSASGLPLAALSADLAPGSLPLEIHDSFKGFWGSSGGPYLASWIEDRTSALYYKNNPVPGVDTGINPNYMPLPAELE
ncbi:MAG: DUF2235 domain-containing protein, partial [Pseudomonadota bacterium]